MHSCVDASRPKCRCYAPLELHERQLFGGWGFENMFRAVLMVWQGYRLPALLRTVCRP